MEGVSVVGQQNTDIAKIAYSLDLNYH